jgi:hypothetical protein
MVERLVFWLTFTRVTVLITAGRGLIVAFGAFESYYAVGLLHDKSESTIAWIGSGGSFFCASSVCAKGISRQSGTGSDVCPVQMFLNIFVAFLTGPMFDAGYLTTLLRVGSLMIVFGMMMTVSWRKSFC